MAHIEYVLAMLFHLCHVQRLLLHRAKWSAAQMTGIKILKAAGCPSLEESRNLLRRQLIQWRIGQAIHAGHCLSK